MKRRFLVVNIEACARRIYQHIAHTDLKLVELIVRVVRLVPGWYVIYLLLFGESAKLFSINHNAKK